MESWITLAQLAHMGSGGASHVLLDKHLKGLGFYHGTERFRQ